MEICTLMLYDAEFWPMGTDWCLKKGYSCQLPGWMGRSVGKIKSSGGMGFTPDHSNTPSICIDGKLI